MLTAVGLVLNIWLYFVDRKMGGVLTKVNKGETLTDLITSPPPAQRKEIAKNSEIHDNVKDYLLNRDQRNALKRSMAKHTM